MRAVGGRVGRVRRVPASLESLASSGGCHTSPPPAVSTPPSPTAEWKGPEWNAHVLIGTPAF